MRLRYLYLPRCGPLTDASVVFGKEELVSRALKLPRKGALNFVVGINGTGKSSLLRALYRTFRALHFRDWPPLPVTIAWDRTVGTENSTAIFHYAGGKDGDRFAATCAAIPTSATRADWKAITEALARGDSHPLAQNLNLTTGPESIQDTQIYAHLPKRLLVYTSGDAVPWEKTEQRVFHPVEELADQYRGEDERPQGWAMEREWEEQQPVRMNNMIVEYAAQQEAQSPGNPIDFDSQSAPWWWEAMQPMVEISRKVSSNTHSRHKQAEDSFLRITNQDLRYAAMALALWQCSRELAGRHSEQERAGLRQELIQRRHSTEKPDDARRVLNEIEWFWPTHLSLTYRDADDRVSARQHRELVALTALADDVVKQPLGRAQAVVPLGPIEGQSVAERLSKAFPFGIGSKQVEDIAKRMDKATTGAEAVLRLFSADDNVDSTPMDFFLRLRDWERTGLMEHITLTVKRLHQVEAHDGEPDDVIVTWDQLSDGEQMLLGRIGLLFLLRGQDGSLLLLDEPETHFNDVWKREIVDMVDTALLNTTHAGVIVCTHTSIALTDAFAAEVTVLDKQNGQTNARSVTGGLFGTDPGEVNMNLFGAGSSIGSRSLAILDRLLETDWKGRGIELEEILKVLGSSFHRAELRALLKQLRTDGAA